MRSASIRVVRAAVQGLYLGHGARRSAPMADALKDNLLLVTSDEPAPIPTDVLYSIVDACTGPAATDVRAFG
eukprot:SAG22_NODE_751_length_7449_cov_14.062721_1_plen_72_part_00